MGKLTLTLADLSKRNGVTRNGKWAFPFALKIPEKIKPSFTVFEDDDDKLI